MAEEAESGTTDIWSNKESKGGLNIFHLVMISTFEQYFMKLMVTIYLYTICLLSVYHKCLPLEFGHEYQFLGVVLFGICGGRV